MEKGSDEILFLQKTVLELQRVVFDLSARVVQVEQALEKERAQKAAAGRASAKKRWSKPEVITALQIPTPKKTRPRKEKIDAVITALQKPKPVSPIYELVEYWRAEYCRVYNTKAMMASKKDYGHAKFILEKCGTDLERATALVTHFMNRRESWYVTKGHTLQTLVCDIERLWAELGNGQIISTHDARRASLLEHNASVASKPMAENPLDTFDQLVESFMGGSNGNTGIQGADPKALSSASSGFTSDSESRSRGPVRIGSSKN